MTDDIPAAPNSNSIATKPDKPKRVSAIVKRACDLLASGDAKSIKHASELIGCSREHLSRQFGKVHVQTYLTRRASRKIATAVLRAAQVKVDLLAAGSEHVRNNASTDVLAIGGIVVPQQQASVNVNLDVRAGFIIDLGPEPCEGAKVIDVTPAAPRVRATHGESE